MNLEFLSEFNNWLGERMVSRSFWKKIGAGAFVGVVILLLAIYFLAQTSRAADTGDRVATQTSDCVNDTSAGSAAWTNPGNAATSDSSYASNSIGNNTTTNRLRCTGFDFTSSDIPVGSTIDGISVVTGTRRQAAQDVRDSQLYLVKDGSVVGQNKADTSTVWYNSTTAFAIRGYGGTTDLWGETWTQSDVTDPDFGVVLTATRTGGGPATPIAVGSIAIRVYYTPPSPWTSINQRQGVITNDQNNTVLNSHTAKIGERLRVITQVDTNTGDTPVNKVFKLQYDKNSSGTWEDVRPGGEIRPARSSIIGLDEDVGTGRAGTCTGGVTAGKGFMFEDTGRTKAIPIQSLACHDVGFVVDTKNATAGTSYRFRLYDMFGNAALNSYAGYASFTAVSSGNDTIRASKSNTTSLPSTQANLKSLLDNQGYSNINTDDAAREILQNVTSDTTADWTQIGGGANYKYGNSVASAGDVNGDGYDDVIVGASGYSSNTGRAYIYYGGESMDSTADVTMSGEATSSYFGNSVASAGDVNGDGYDDVIVGAWGYSSNTGRAYVYYGGESMDSTADLTMSGEGANARFGHVVTKASDINHDGYDDIAVGAPGHSTNTGRVYVYYGGSSMDTTADVTLTGGATNYYFGWSIASAGDVNGDGYVDVAVSAPGYSTNTGRAYVYYGGSSMDTTADVTMGGSTINSYFGASVASAGDVNGDGYRDIMVGAANPSGSDGANAAYVYYGGSSMDTTADVTMGGENSGDGFGYSVSPVGDINGDGYDDVAVGARLYSSSTGRVYIYHGGTSMNSVADVVTTGEMASAGFGQSMALAGDVNGDGFADVIIGASGNNSSTGKAYIYYQSYQMDDIAERILTGDATGGFGAASASAGDVNGDGYDDVIVGASGYSSNTGRVYIYFGGPDSGDIADVVITGESSNWQLGRSVASAGDVNGDGYDDVIVGASWYNSQQGRAHIYFGGPSMDAVADVVFLGETTGNNFGESVASVGDVNSDGYDDVIVGAPSYSSNTGRAYVYYGDGSMDNTADVTMTGESSQNLFGLSVSGGGDYNGDGYDDVVVGARGYSSNAGRVYVYFGGTSFDNTADVTMTGVTYAVIFGTSISHAGDVNGDGYDDLLVGELQSPGHAFIFYGGSSMDSTADVILTAEEGDSEYGLRVAGAGDINGDGYDDVIVGAHYWNDPETSSSHVGKAYVYYGGVSMDDNADFTMFGEAASDLFGQSVAAVGDVNGDGFGDVMVGASGGNKSYLYLGGASSFTPVFNFAQKHTTVCSDATRIDASWNGQTSVSAATTNLFLQVYRFGTTNAWTTVATSSSLSANADGTINGTRTSNLSQYCDGSNWSYWRLYQAGGTQTLQTDAFSINFVGSGGAPPVSTPPMDQRLRGGNWWLDGARQFLHLD